MATYKIVEKPGVTLASLHRILKYVAEQKEGTKGRVYKSVGINVSDDYEKAYSDMVMSKEIHEKMEGRQYKHHVQSFKIGEVSPELAYKVGVDFAKKVLKNFDVFLATHEDKNHIHNHFVINSVCNLNGKKLDEINDNTFLKQGGILKEEQLFIHVLRNENDKICQKYGLSVIQKGKIESINLYGTKEYYSYLNHINDTERSYKIDLSYFVREIAEKSRNKEEFIKKMKFEKNVNVLWEEGKKNIVFSFDNMNKKKIRLANLKKTYHDDFFSKESLEMRFLENIKKEESKTEDFLKLYEEKVANVKKIEKYKEYLKKPHELLLNKLSKNAYFRISKEILSLKKELQQNGKRGKIPNLLKEKEAELEQIEIAIVKEYSVLELKEGNENILNFYENKIKELEEVNADIQEKIMSFARKNTKRKDLEEYDLKKQFFLFYQENKKMLKMISKYEQVDIPLLALNNVTKGAASKLTKEFYKLGREKENVVLENETIFQKIKSANKITEMQSHQISLQQKFRELKKNNIEKMGNEISRITAVLEMKKELLQQKIGINNMQIESIQKLQKMDSARKIEKPLRRSKNTEHKEKPRSGRYEFDEEPGGKHGKKGRHL